MIYGSLDKPPFMQRCSGAQGTARHHGQLAEETHVLTWVDHTAEPINSVAALSTSSHTGFPCLTSPPIALADIKEGDIRERLEHCRKTRGFTPSSIMTMVRRPNIVWAFMARHQAVLQEGTVPEEAKLLVSLARSFGAGCLLTCRQGIAAMQQAHPDVDIYTAPIDRQLDEHGYILPGLGDAGDRIFGTK